MAPDSFKNQEEGFRWFESLTNLETIRASKDRQAYRLDRMRHLLAMFGDPHLACPTIHVAGSKGKGSTAALMAAALTESGGPAGLYTSPHVMSYTERIMVDSRPVDPDLLVRHMNAIHEAVEAIGPNELQVSPKPTTFELLTLLAFLAYREVGCRYAVIEVGIGGRLDATNVVRPVLTVITPIELEHTDILGDTLPEIAREKAGIIKQGIPVFSAAQRPEARGEIERIASELRAPLTFADEAARVTDVTVGPWGTRFGLRVGARTRDVRLRLPGRFQAENASLALLALRALDNGPSDEQIRRGFARAVLPGRMELMRTAGPLPRRDVVLDGAHTPTSVSRAAETFLEMFPDGGTLLFGSVAGKRTEEMAEVLAPQFASIVISKPNPFKESDPQEVFGAFARRNPSCVLEVDPLLALRAACAAPGARPILATGSFYLISEIRRHLVPMEDRSFLGGRLRVLVGDITDVDVEALVNAANSTLLGGGGVDGAIHRAGGPRILAECKEIRRTRYPDGLPPGKAVATSGGALRARFVIHTVGPVYRGGGSSDAETLASAYRESLAVAVEVGARTAAFPAISTGIYGYPKDQAACIAYAAIKDHLLRSELPEQVMLVFFSESDASTFLRAACPE